MNEEDYSEVLDQAARETVELGNRLGEADEDADMWDIADGLLAGAIQFWLYSRQPCDDPGCEDCFPLATADARLKELITIVTQYATESEYYHSPNDSNAGRA